MTPYYSDDLVSLFLGDCLEVTEWLSADVLVTDPPYGKRWDYNGYNATKSLHGKNKHSGIQGDATTEVRDNALVVWGSKPALCFGSPLVAIPSNTKQILVWHKPPNAGVIGSLTGWRQDWEAVYVVGSWPKATAQRSSVIRSRGHTSQYASGHPHAKPIDLMSILIQAFPGVVADPFAGSGSTLVAAKALGRKAIGVEIDECYCEIAANRLAQDAFDFGGAA